MAWNDPETLRARFSFVCDVPVEEMSSRKDGIRHCARCAKDVYPARSAEEFDARAREGVCVYAINTDQDTLVAAPPPPPNGPPATAGVPYDPNRFRRGPLPEPTPRPPAKKPPRTLLMVSVFGGLLLGGGLLFCVGLGLGWLLFG